MFRRFRGANFREFSMSLLNYCPMLRKRNGTRTVYCNRLCGGMSSFAFTTLATIQQAHTKLPEDGASEAPKHVRVN
jgi:hypothetical protein